MHWLTLIFLTLNCACLQAQFTYFNQITGDLDDEESESTANIEVVDDGYVIWGGGVNDGVLFHFVRKYNLNGTIDGENILVHEGQYVLGGIINTFKWNPAIDRFVYIHGTNLNDGTTEGYLIEFDENLDTTFTKRYDHYSPYTYPFVFEVMDDGYVVVGEQGGLPNSAGTFIMKLDFEGNVVWTEILQEEVYQHIYRNIGIMSTNGGYMVSGWGLISSEPFGLLTIVDDQGNTIETIQYIDPEMPRSNGVLTVRLENDYILLAQSFGYELVDENGNPNVFWNKLRISELDEETLDTTGVVEHFDNYEFYHGGPYDIIATPEGGAIILGGYYYAFAAKAWMLKVDADGHEEWYQEYTYETCDDCTNILYDIELTADGGYIAAGSFTNYAVDPRNATWLVKVDACGDLEWQGCAPLNVPERQRQSFVVYPNPSQGQFTVETSTQSRAKFWRVYDLSGRQVAQGGALQSASQFSLDLDLPSGFYTLQVGTDDGKMEAYKIQVVK